MAVNITKKFSDLEILAVDVVFNLLSYRQILCYRPPGYNTNDSSYFNRFLTCLREICDTESTLVLVGDFNLPCISWSYIPSIVKHDSFHASFLDFVSQFGLSQFVRGNTRAKNTLDLVLTSDPLIIHDCSTSSPLGSSDHETVTFNLSLPMVEDDCYPYVKFACDFKNADYDLLNTHVSSID